MVWKQVLILCSKPKVDVIRLFILSFSCFPAFRENGFPDLALSVSNELDLGRGLWGTSFPNLDEHFAVWSGEEAY